MGREDGSKRTVKKESTEHDNTLGTGKAEIKMETIIKILPGMFKNNVTPNTKDIMHGGQEKSGRKDQLRTSQWISSNNSGSFKNMSNWIYNVGVKVSAQSWRCKARNHLSRGLEGKHKSNKNGVSFCF